jgi:hypothetical protein
MPTPKGEADSKPAAAFFWRKLDQPGHDSCRLFRLAGGWKLAGAAVFQEGGRPCHLAYEVTADAAFRTRRAKVSGYFGHKAIDLRIASAGLGAWRVDGLARPDLAGCLDVDLGFTPATNLLPLRRLGLKVGQAAEAPAGYLELPRMRFLVLPQRYERTGRHEYAYESPRHGYAATLRVASSGAVIEYPGLFELVRRPTA